MVTFADYRDTLRRSWLFVVALPLLGALIGFGMSQRATPVYQAQASIFVTIDAAGAMTSSLTPQQRMDGYAALATSTAVLKAASEETRGSAPAQEVAGSVAASVAPATTVLTITATADDAGKAAVIANAVAEATAQEINETGSTEVVVSTTKDGREKKGKIIVQAEVSAPATPPSAPVSPRALSIASVGFLLGLTVGVGGPLLLESLNPRVRKPRDLEGAPDAPFLGRVRLGSGDRDDLALVHAALLRQNAIEGPTAFVVAPVEPTPSAALVAAGLAGELTDHDESVALVQWGTAPDVSDPSGEALGPLQGEESARDTRGFDVVTSISSSAGGSALGATRGAIDELKGRYRWVVLQAPPLLDSSEAVLLASAADGIVLLVAGGTPAKAVQEAVDALRRTGSRILGLVLL